MLGPVAHADTLLSNSGSGDFILNVNVYHPQMVAQRFTTGPGTYGWELESIQLKVADAPDDTFFVSVAIVEACSVEPCPEVVFLVKPTTISTGWNTFTSTPATKLEPDNSYEIRVQHLSADTDDFQLNVSDNNLMKELAPGWELPWRHLEWRDDDNDDTFEWVEIGAALRIHMEGRDLDDTEISAIEVASTPARGDTYGLGETIEVEVTFNQDADVTDPANTFASLFVGPGSAFNQWRRLQYHSGSGSDTLSFRYTVAANDNDPDGVTIGYTVGRDQDVTYIVTRGTDKAVDPYFGGGNVNAGSQHQVDGRIVPTISSVELTSNPNDDDREGDDDTYAIGDVIEATVTFDREVTVDVTNGKPTLELDVGGTPVLAAYADGSESTELVFRYAVAEGLQDAGGIAIGANKLELNGGTIAGFADASLDHDAEADDAAHRVDGVRPTFVDAEVWPTDPRWSG